MSDLFCAATILLARHGEASYVEDWFSDEGGTLTLTGREQAAALAERVARQRPVHVWCSDSSRAVQTAEIVAARLGIGVSTRKSLREIQIGELLGGPFDLAAVRAVTDRWAEGDLDARFPGGESGYDVVARHREQLSEIADACRGETALVIGHESALCAAVPGLATNLRPPYPPACRRLANGQLLELVVDADGWVLKQP